MTDAVDLLCRFALSLCVWREARGESDLGKRLVAQTVENRVTDPRWPDTYVGVITQRWQFSAFNPGDPNATKFPSETDPAWPACVAASDFILSSPPPITSSNHYHVIGLHPAWEDPNKVVAIEGAHVFYAL